MYCNVLYCFYFSDTEAFEACFRLLHDDDDTDPEINERTDRQTARNGHTKPGTKHFTLENASKSLNRENIADRIIGRALVVVMATENEKFWRVSGSCFRTRLVLSAADWMIAWCVVVLHANFFICTE